MKLIRNIKNFFSEFMSLNEIIKEMFCFNHRFNNWRTRYCKLYEITFEGDEVAAKDLENL